MANTRNRVIYDTRDLETASKEILDSVHKALVRVAFKLRDEMRDEFNKSHSAYKYGTQDYYDLAKGIMVGKTNKDEIKIHALGHRNDDGTYKTRFFVGGTQYRKTSYGNKGYLKDNEAVDKGMRNAQNILDNYFNNIFYK